MLQWFKVGVDLGDHPKVFKLAALLETNEIQALGFVVRFWSFTAKFCGKGDLKYSAEQVEMACRWRGSKSGLFDALTQAGFIDLTPEGPVVHDWFDENGYHIKDIERKREQRRGRADGADAGAPRLRTDIHTRQTGQDIQTKTPFLAFWDAYPKCGSRGKPKRKPAEDKWERLTEEKRVQAMGGLMRHKASTQWLKENGQFIPAAVVYLNQELWHDDVDRGGGGGSGARPQGGPFPGGGGAGAGPKTSFGAGAKPVQGHGAEASHG